MECRYGDKAGTACYGGCRRGGEALALGSRVGHLYHIACWVGDKGGRDLLGGRGVRILRLWHWGSQAGCPCHIACWGAGLLGDAIPLGLGVGWKVVCLGRENGGKD